MARIFDVIEYANEMTDELVHRFPDDGTTGDYRLGSNVIVRTGQSASLLPRWPGVGYVRPWSACHRHRKHSVADPETAGYIHQRQRSFPCGSLLRLDEGIPPAQVGHSPANPGQQSGYGLGCHAAAGFWYLFIRGQRPAAIGNSDRRQDGILSHRPDRRPLAQHSPVPTSGYPE